MTVIAKLNNGFLSSNLMGLKRTGEFYEDPLFQVQVEPIYSVSKGVLKE